MLIVCAIVLMWWNAVLCNNLGQVVYISVPLLSSSITWYQCKAGRMMAGYSRGVIYHP